MNWEAISAIGQLVGALAVVISLIYVAREIRSNARSARMASMGSLNRLLGQIATHPHLAEVWNRGLRDWHALEGADQRTFDAFVLQLFHVFKELYFQHLEGHLDPRLWHEAENAMRDVIYRSPGVQAWWGAVTSLNWFSEEFVNYVNQLGQTAEPPKDVSRTHDG